MNVLGLQAITMAELNENFYSSKTHKYPPSSFLVLLGNSNCGMQMKIIEKENIVRKFLGCTHVPLLLLKKANIKGFKF